MDAAIRPRVLLIAALLCAVAASSSGQAVRTGPPARPEGPCDVYAAAGTPCVAAHSTTRALYAAYSGPLYQVLRQSDGRTRDIGVVAPRSSPRPDAGGYADSAAQDEFCANTWCWISVLYDQSPRGNHLVQAPRGGFSGPAMGGFNNLPLADRAPVTVMGHKVYGVFIAPGMGLRLNDARGTAVDDQAQGQYWVIDGQHFNSGCCFDYGNAETDSRDDGNGTMETTYYGNATSWYRGIAPGPWIMTDQENNLVGCVNADGSRYCAGLPSISWRFVTAMAKGEPHHWTSLGGNAQSGALTVMFDGPRIDRSYDPMRKQGAILLGNGGDNSNGSQGTFYEGAMTAPGTFPGDAVDQRVQANVVAAGYQVAPLALAPAAAVASPGLQTFAPRSSRALRLAFTNTTGAPVSGVALSLALPRGWSAVAEGGSAMVQGPLAPGATAGITFNVTSAAATYQGDIVGNASWKRPDGTTGSARTVLKVRNASAVSINEFRVSAGASANTTDSFIELHNAGATSVDLSGWTLTEHAAQQATFSAVKIPPGTRLAPRGFYLLGLANSGLVVPARAGERTLHVRSVAGMNVGDTVEIDTGAAREVRRIAAVGTAATPATTLWQPLPEGPVIRIPAGSTRVPVNSVAGFAVGERIALGHGATYPAVGRTLESYEVATVTEVGKPGTQAWLTADAKAGSTNLKVSSVANITAGDRIRLDIASTGHGIETVTVARVGTASVRNAFNGPLAEADLGTGLELAAPLQFSHSSNMPFSVHGTGIAFTPATAFAHASNEPVQALGTGITLDAPLARAHAIDAVVRDGAVTTAGYQGSPAPQVWFGGPALSSSAGSMVLRDATGIVVDSLNYGLLVDPWMAEGYQGTSGAGQAGCRVPVPASGGGGFFAGPPAAFTPHRSAGRFPDGADTDSNCTDFLLQPATLLSVPASAGATNIKVASVADLRAGQALSIDVGAARETAVITAVGSAGATTVRVAAAAGATVIPVASVAGFTAGQAIVLGDGNGNAQEQAVVAATTGGGRGGANASITLAEPLKNALPQGAQVAGTGLTLAAALARTHAAGIQVNAGLPTPGGPNQFERATR